MTCPNLLENRYKICGNPQLYCFHTASLVMRYGLANHDIDISR